jgi:hypothetical protein
MNRLRELQAKTSVRLMFTSRFIPEIKEKFQFDPMLEVRASEHDVRRYVAGQLPRLPKCIQRSSVLSVALTSQISCAPSILVTVMAYVEIQVEQSTLCSVLFLISSSVPSTAGISHKGW